MTTTRARGTPCSRCGAILGPAAVFGTWKAPRPEKTRHRLIWDKQDGTGAGMGDLDAAFGNSDEEIYLLGDWPKTQQRQSNVIRTRMKHCVARAEGRAPNPRSR